MAVESIPVPLKSRIPEFNLKDPFGKNYSEKDLFAEKGLLVIFTCNHCPYAVAIWPRLVEIADEYKSRGIETVAINSNINPDYPEDSPEKMKEYIKTWGIGFPYLVDATQQVADEFVAQCTPDLYLYNEKKELFYHGRFDKAGRDHNMATGEDIRTALDALVSGGEPPQPQHPSIGCSIKWND